jgi:hypothetical protein
MLDEQQHKIQAITADRVEQAIEQEVQNFRAGLGDLKEADVYPHVQRLTADPDYQEALESGDAKLARSAMRALLKEAKAEARLDVHKAGLARKAQASTTLRTIKTQASASGAPTATGPGPRREMTQKEIDSQLKEMVRTGQIT